MAQNNNIADKTNYASQPSIPSGQKYSSTEFNIIKNFQKKQGGNQGVFDETNIVIDGTGTYNNKTYDQPTLTLNFVAGDTDSGDNKKFLKVILVQDTTVAASGIVGDITDVPEGNIYTAGTYHWKFKHDPVNGVVNFEGGVRAAGGVTQDYDKTVTWSWDNGTDDGLYIIFTIAGASANEIETATNLWVAMNIQPDANYSIVTDTVANDSIRVLKPLDFTTNPDVRLQYNSSNIGVEGSGVATINTFNPSIRADGEETFPLYEATGIINFVKDASVSDTTAPGTFPTNGYGGVIKSLDGAVWNFPKSDFVISGCSEVGVNYVLTPEIDNFYNFYVFWTGQYFMGGVAHIGVNTPLPILQTPTISTVAGDGQITLNIDSEDAAATGRIWLKSTTNDVGTGIAVAGYDDSLSFVDTDVVNDTTYYLWFLSTAAGYQNSATVSSSATPVIDYTFANTHRLVIDANSEGIIFDNNNAIPAIDVSDEIITHELWFTTPSTIPTLINFVMFRDDNDGSNIGSISLSGTGTQLTLLMKTDASNTILATWTKNYLPDTTYHIIIGKTGLTQETCFCYIDNVDQGLPAGTSVGTYAGWSIVGNLEINIANSSGGTGGLGKYDLYRIFHYDVGTDGHTYLWNSGIPVGLAGKSELLNSCVQELLLNNNANADNIGVNGTPVGPITYEVI